MIPSALKAVVFDWAGTMIDFGSRAPVVALMLLFEAEGVPITEVEARAAWESPSATISPQSSPPRV